MEIDYESDKPDFDGYGAVQLWAAYASHPGLQPPERFASNWHDDVAFGKSSQLSGPVSHIIGPELWLPVDVRETFEAQELNGNRIKIGSVFELWRGLRELNDASWRASDQEVRQWREQDFDPERLESIARWGYSIWFCLTDFAVRNRFPMRLDY